MRLFRALAFTKDEYWMMAEALGCIILFILFLYGMVWAIRLLASVMK